MSEINNDFDKNAWAEKKKEEKEDAYKMIDETALSLKDEKKLEAYFYVQGRFDKYSVGNALLITAQNPNATKLKDYDGWKEKNNNVLPKQKGITILEPTNEYRRKDGSVAVNYNVKKLFDISQTSKKEETITKIDERFVLKALITNSVVPVKVSENLEQHAFYDDKEKVVYVKKGLTNPEFFKSVSTELAHATFAKAENYSRGQYNFNANAVSYILSKKYGIERELPNVPNSFKESDVTDIRTTLAEIRNCMTSINEKMSINFEKGKADKSKGSER